MKGKYREKVACFVISFMVKDAGAVMLLFRLENTTRVTAVYVII